MMASTAPGTGDGRSEEQGSLRTPQGSAAGEVLHAPLPKRITGGIVAFNDESRVERSVRSLLSQELPAGYEWSHVWLVGSGCTDRTVEIGQAVAREDPRLRVLVQPTRRGKAAAIQEILDRVEGETVVLLNSDAIARAGAVSALLAKGVGKAAPFAVMARPVIAEALEGDWDKTLEWMWDLHHEYHLDLLADGRGTHLSDELLLLGGPKFPPMPEGVINDGSYLAVWLRQRGGGCWYAPEALVEIDTPLSRADHLRQRRRIHVGNFQVARLLGSPPATLPRSFWRHPVSTARTVVRMARRASGIFHLTRLAAAELFAHTLAWWDRLPPARDHVRWERIGTADRVAPDLPHPVEEDDLPTATIPATVDGRIRTLLEIAELFATGLRLDELVDLLPPEAPATPEEARAWFRAHPGVGHLEGDRVFSPRRAPQNLPARRERGERYRQAARLLLEQEFAPALPWLRCVAISGSTAYGEPEAGDDLDLFVVTRAGALWLALGWTYLALRWRTLGARPRTDPPVCLNYVLDDRSAPSEFSRRSDFHVAREALMSDVVRGGDYYRSLLGSARWMSSEIPRLYTQRIQGAQSPEPDPAPIGVQILNAVAFLALAPYLQLVGLRRNRQLAREGRLEEIFRTTTRWRQLAFGSRRFDSLRERHRPLGSGLGPNRQAPSGRRASSHRTSSLPQRAEPNVR